MAKSPKADPKRDWYWPLGALSYASEIQECYPEEAELLGVMTILWNRQELAMRALYKVLIASKRPDYAMAVWDRQPTHKARRDLLALAFHTVKLTKRQRAILTWVLDNTKAVADRRNELIHAEYVVHGRTDVLHAKVSPPNSAKPPKHQRVDVKDLSRFIDDLQLLVQATEQTRMEFDTRAQKRLMAKLDKLGGELRQSRENPQSDSPPPSRPQTPDAEPHSQPPPSQG